MATAALPPAPPPAETMADLLERLGGISPARVRMSPPPGTATEQDVVDIEGRENRLFELVDGVLVEKVCTFRESILAGAIAAALRAFVLPRKLGVVTGSDGMMSLFSGLVRMPDVAFVSWARMPYGVPKEAAPALAPDLAVEVLCEGNTKAEIDRKRSEYFSAGTLLVWQIDRRTRTATVFTDPATATGLDESKSLDGYDVLPGFTLPLRDLFAEIDALPEI